MRNCPKCGEKTISKKELFLSAIGVPGIVAHCRSCYAIVGAKKIITSLFGGFIRGWFGMMVEVHVTGAIVIVIALWSIITFGTVWIGVFVFIFWWVLRAYLSMRAPLVYDGD